MEKVETSCLREKLCTSLNKVTPLLSWKYIIEALECLGEEKLSQDGSYCVKLLCSKIS